MARPCWSPTATAATAKVVHPLARALAARGFQVLLFDYRGYGRQPGESERATVWPRMRGRRTTTSSPRPGSTPASLIYFGESLGGGVVTELATAASTGGDGAAISVRRSGRHRPGALSRSSRCAYCCATTSPSPSTSPTSTSRHRHLSATRTRSCRRPKAVRSQIELPNLIGARRDPRSGPQRCRARARTDRHRRGRRDRRRVQAALRSLLEHGWSRAASRARSHRSQLPAAAVNSSSAAARAVSDLHPRTQ